MNPGKTSHPSPVSRRHYLKLYESIESVVDEPDTTQCTQIPLPFDYSDDDLCNLIPADPYWELSGYIDEMNLMVFPCSSECFLRQQNLRVWQSIPSQRPEPRMRSPEWLYHFLVNRPLRAIVTWRDRCWIVDKTQSSIDIIVSLLRWRRLCLFFSTDELVSKVVGDRQAVRLLIQSARGQEVMSANTAFDEEALMDACGIRIRQFSRTSSI